VIPELRLDCGHHRLQQHTFLTISVVDNVED
jgi:hypothetical protein